MDRSRYTPTQLNAIDHFAGSLQLIACAGSGKSEVVAQRVVSLLWPAKEGSGGASPKDIIAFTLTDQEAAELKERIHTRCRERSATSSASTPCTRTRSVSSVSLNDVQQAPFVDRHFGISGMTLSTTLGGKTLKRYVDTRNYVSGLGILREDRPTDPAKLAGNAAASHLPECERQLYETNYLDYSGILKEAGEDFRRAAGRCQEARLCDSRIRN